MFEESHANCQDKEAMYRNKGAHEGNCLFMSDCWRGLQDWPQIAVYENGRAGRSCCEYGPLEQAYREHAEDLEMEFIKILNSYVRNTKAGISTVNE